MANLSKMKRERMLAFLDIIREEHKDNDVFQFRLTIRDTALL